MLGDGKLLILNSFWDILRYRRHSGMMKYVEVERGSICFGLVKSFGPTSEQCDVLPGHSLVNQFYTLSMEVSWEFVPDPYNIMFGPSTTKVILLGVSVVCLR